jgi:transglutaminase-like putative cysteine protease
MDAFLRPTEIIDWQHLAVLQVAKLLADGVVSQREIARRCFEWVRDEIKHSNDYYCNPITCSASEVLAARTGFCYAKSHLLAALLRANSIPAGLCYQRLSIDGQSAPFCLHGLNAIFLADIGWYRVDPRGNKSGINAQFRPPTEQLAFSIQVPGEANLPEIWADPLPTVIQSLRHHQTYDSLANDLPDVPLIATCGLTNFA